MMTKVKVCSEFDVDQLAGMFEPISSISIFAGSEIPTGFLNCDGAEVSREDYAELYALIGDIWGEGDGSTTFNLPDLRDEFIRGATASNAVGAMQQDAMQQITGSIENVYLNTTYPNAQGVFSASSSVADKIVNSYGSGAKIVPLEFDSAMSPDARTADETRPRNVAVTFGIKAFHPVAASS
ncbi:phage tail protein [Thalassospira lucentensis]|uniref:phage tail protein n=1 Tax=Thalassospira lucentensis TaxID=168935 RepID=UPI0003B3ADA6|nr:phage tail protein [Thalassospira lucentensis]